MNTYPSRKEKKSGKRELVTVRMRKQTDKLSVEARGRDSHMKQTGMLVVSLRGVNFGFWSRLGCSGQSANILSRQGLV